MLFLSSAGRFPKGEEPGAIEGSDLACGAGSSSGSVDDRRGGSLVGSMDDWRAGSRADSDACASLGPAMASESAWSRELWRPEHPSVFLVTVRPAKVRKTYLRTSGKRDACTSCDGKARIAATGGLSVMML